jgi:hypothetical protein
MNHKWASGIIHENGLMSLHNGTFFVAYDRTANKYMYGRNIASNFNGGCYYRDYVVPTRKLYCYTSDRFFAYDVVLTSINTDGSF